MSFHPALLNSIFIFNDVACDKQDAIRKYFAMERHADCFYLYRRMQRYRSNNANLLILFKQDGNNLKRVYNVNTDMSYENFCDLCRKCWQQKYRFAMIDKDSALIDG